MKQDSSTAIVNNLEAMIGDISTVVLSEKMKTFEMMIQKLQEDVLQANSGQKGNKQVIAKFLAQGADVKTEDVAKIFQE